MLYNRIFFFFCFRCGQPEWRGQTAASYVTRAYITFHTYYCMAWVLPSHTSNTCSNSGSSKAATLRVCNPFSSPKRTVVRPPHYRQSVQITITITTTTNLSSPRTSLLFIPITTSSSFLSHLLLLLPHLTFCQHRSSSVGALANLCPRTLFPGFAFLTYYSLLSVLTQPHPH